MQDQVPIYLSANQFADLFLNPPSDSQQWDEITGTNQQIEPTLEFSFSALQIASSQKSISELSNVETPTQVVVSKEQYLQIMLQIEQNRILNEQYQQLLRENQDQLQKRKHLEDQGSALLDENFQIKRNIQEMKQKLLIAQSAIPLRRDKQIIELKNQLKELQLKSAEKRDTQQSTTLTENSTVDSEKSNSYYCNTSRLIRVDQSSSHHQPKKPYRSRNNSFNKIIKN